MQAHRLIALLCISSAACAQTPAANQPATHTIAPGKAHEACFPMKVGDALNYKFQSPVGLDFNVHYHQGEKVVEPIREAGAKTSEGNHTAKVENDYCLMWINRSREPAALEYAWQVKPK